MLAIQADTEARTKFKDIFSIVLLSNNFLVFALCLIMYTVYNVPMMVMMYRKHYLAFKSHAWRQILLLVIYISSFYVVLKSLFIKTSFTVCVQWFSNDGLGDFCTDMAERAIAEEQRKFTWLEIIEMLPVASFLILN